MSEFTWQKQHLSQGKCYGAKELRCKLLAEKKRKKKNNDYITPDMALKMHL